MSAASDGLAAIIDSAGNVAVLITDVVVEGVGHFAAIDVAGEVPDEAVVNRMRLHARQLRTVAPAQEAQLLFEQRCRLVHEAMQ